MFLFLNIARISFKNKAFTKSFMKNFKNNKSFTKSLYKIHICFIYSFIIIFKANYFLLKILDYQTWIELASKPSSIIYQKLHEKL